MKIIFYCVLFAAIGSFSGCRKEEAVRSYSEVVITSPLRAPGSLKGMQHPPMGERAGAEMTAPDQMPMGELPPDHPPIEGMPMGELPDGHPPIGGMSMPGGAQADALMASVANTPLTWQTPQGWSEIKGNGMRVVSFSSSDKKNSIDCSIVSLGGQAGGIKANVVRWMGQLQIASLPEKEFNDFVSRQQKFTAQGDLQGTIFDFSELQKGNADSTKSMMATMIELPGNVVFVKMTGSKAALAANKKQFLALCQSLSLN